MQIVYTKIETSKEVKFMPMQELSNLQIELLKMYSNGVSEKNLHEIKLMLAKYFADQVSDAMDEVWEGRNWPRKIWLIGRMKIIALKIVVDINILIAIIGRK